MRDNGLIITGMAMVNKH
jgi:hypothetical protein